MDGTEKVPFAMSEKQWKETTLCIAKYYGETRYNGELYTIMRKDGKDYFEAAAEAASDGRSIPIEEGEPRDLVREDFVPFYKRFKRERFWGVIMSNPGKTDEEYFEIFKKLMVTCRTCKFRKRVKLNEYSERLITICLKRPVRKGDKGYKYINATDMACNLYEKDLMA